VLLSTPVVISDLFFFLLFGKEEKRILTASFGNFIHQCSKVLSEVEALRTLSVAEVFAEHCNVNILSNVNVRK